MAIGSLRPDLPPEVERLVTRALSRAPRDRQPSMTAVKDGVLACLGVVERAGTGPTPVPGPSLGVTQQMVSSSTARVDRRPLARGAESP